MTETIHVIPIILTERNVFNIMLTFYDFSSTCILDICIIIYK